MAEIKNYTLNFGCGPLLRSLDFAVAKSAFAEMERGSLCAQVGVYG